MIEHRTKLWLGLGSFLLAGTSGVALAVGGGDRGPDGVDPGAGRGGAVEIAAGNEGGERGRAKAGGEGGEGGEGGRAKAGGEGGEGGTAPGSPDVVFLTLLGKMDGHMLAAKRLFDGGHGEMAKPHFHHPYLEVYEIIEADLKARGIPPFEGILKELGKAGDGGDARKIADAYEAAREAVAKARATVRADVLGSATTQLQVAVALLESAAHEYEEAVKDGRIDVIEEYQDGWGFLQVATRTVAAVSAKVGKIAPDADERIDEHLRTLRRAWPDAVPPERAVLDTAEVHATVSRIELAASRVGR